MSDQSRDIRVALTHDDVYADFHEPDPVFVGGEATDDD